MQGTALLGNGGGAALLGNRITAAGSLPAVLEAGAAAANAPVTTQVRVSAQVSHAAIIGASDALEAGAQMKEMVAQLLAVSTDHGQQGCGIGG